MKGLKGGAEGFKNGFRLDGWLDVLGLMVFKHRSPQA